MLEPPQTMKKPLFNRLAIIGLGLMGASVALGARQQGLAGEVVGFDGSADVRKRAAGLDIVDTVCKTAKEAAQGSDFLILCVPVGVMGDVAKSISGSLKKGAIVSDVGSVKSRVAEEIGPHIPEGVALVPGHPIAGTEQSGPEAGCLGLYEGRWCILTPCGRSSDEEVERVAEFWRGLGSGVEIMTPERHDLVLAITSHVPHLIAYNIVGTAADLETVTESEVIKYSAGGFRDFTRIAASDPTMWRDIFLANKNAVLEMLGRFSEDLAALQRDIRWEDGESLFKLFTRTREIRRGVIDAGQDEDAPDFGRFHGVFSDAIRREMVEAEKTAKSFERLRDAVDDAVKQGIIEVREKASEIVAAPSNPGPSKKKKKKRS